MDNLINHWPSLLVIAAVLGVIIYLYIDTNADVEARRSALRDALSEAQRLERARDDATDAIPIYGLPAVKLRPYKTMREAMKETAREVERGIRYNGRKG